MSNTLPISQLIKLFVSDQDVSELSKQIYARQIPLFFYWVQRNGFDYTTLKRSHILRYKAELMDTKAPATVDAYLTIVRMFYRWASINGHYENIAQGIKSPRQRKEFSKQILTIAQVKQLLAAIDRTTLKGKRNYAIMILLAVRGLRTIELQRANVVDITRVNTTTVMRVQRKGHIAKDEYAELNADVLDILEEYLVERPALSDSQPLFASMSRSNYGQRLTTRTYSGMVKKYLRQIGINDKHITAHSLRHTVAVMLISEGKSIYDVQLYLGHTSPHVTERYTALVEQSRRLNDSPVHTLTQLFNLSANKRLDHASGGVSRNNKETTRQPHKTNQIPSFNR